MNIDLRDRIQGSFARQGLMATLGARLEAVTPGEVQATIVNVPASARRPASTPTQDEASR